MSFSFAPNTPYTFTARMDIPSFARATAAGFTIPKLQGAAQRAGLAIASPLRVSYVRAVVNNVGADTVSMTVNYTGNVARTDDDIAPWLLSIANSVEGAGTLNRFGVAGSGILNYLTLGLTNSGYVVDTSTVRTGTTSAPPVTSSGVVARTAAAATGSQIAASSDPAEIGTGVPVVGANAGLPWYVTTAIVLGAIVVAGVAVSYTVRGFR